mmetsp:Transcript_38070/g.89113  ORF Transcript_38070/g.89113 Transcript_38070/m.89113 type:complete len:219 (+) Transcript_38070:1268-1924(+)
MDSAVSPEVTIACPSLNLISLSGAAMWASNSSGMPGSIGPCLSIGMIVPSSHLVRSSAKLLFFARLWWMSSYRGSHSSGNWSIARTTAGPCNLAHCAGPPLARMVAERWDSNPNAPTSPKTLPGFTVATGKPRLFSATTVPPSKTNMSVSPGLHSSPAWITTSPSAKNFSSLCSHSSSTKESDESLKFSVSLNLFGSFSPLKCLPALSRRPNWCRSAG